MGRMTLAVEELQQKVQASGLQSLATGPEGRQVSPPSVLGIISVLDINTIKK